LQKDDIAIDNRSSLQIFDYCDEVTMSLARKKVMLVFGTRPEAIKMCPLVNALKNRPEGFDVVVTVTGQHREMLQQVLDVFGVVPDHNLNIMKPGQTLFDVTCEVLMRLKPVLEEEKPEAVLVHGDTTTSFAAALACFYLQIPVGHVEAGLRTHDIYSPWPEEFNRQAVDIVTRWYFAPTKLSRQNLLDEGKPKESIWVTGNTGIDALRTTVRRDYSDPELDWARGSKLILVTAHRRENLDEPMHHMFRAIRRVMEEHPDTKMIYPIHMNPLVRKAAHEELDGFDRVHIIEPLDVLDFHNYMAHSYLVLTDSGGIQEEAPSLGKPVLVMRDTTERPEGVAAGTLKLVGTDEDVVYREFSRLLSDKDEYAAMSHACNPYGDGYASERIADVLEGKDVQWA
jgi:UDP-N-acetylglucosamine 2-epimerase (non-hydrolysing)